MDPLLRKINQVFEANFGNLTADEFNGLPPREQHKIFNSVRFEVRLFAANQVHGDAGELGKVVDERVSDFLFDDGSTPQIEEGKR